MNENLKKELKKHFVAVKVEVEAKFNRPRACSYCSEPFIECVECGGEGVYNYSTCFRCHGLGHYLCGHCGGDSNPLASNEALEQHFKEQLPSEMLDNIIYLQLYRDPSVDTEVTATFEIDDIDKLPVFVEEFAKLKDVFGGTIDVNNAGMHLSLLTTKEYPCTKNLQEHRWNNFKTQVEKLLPALLMLSTPDDKTRGLGFRQLQISTRDKYSAIYAQGLRGSIEFRIFETCYDEPSKIIDFFEVIAKLIKYYNNTRLKVPTLNKTFYLRNDGGRMREDLNRFFQYAENVEVVENQLKYLYPDIDIDEVFDKFKIDRQAKKLIEAVVERAKEGAKETEQNLKDSYERTIEYAKRSIEDTTSKAYLKHKIMLEEFGASEKQAIELAAGVSNNRKLIAIYNNLNINTGGLKV